MSLVLLSVVIFAGDESISASQALTSSTGAYFIVHTILMFTLHLHSFTT